MKRISVMMVIMGLMVTTPARSGSLTVTHTFQGGQKALASEVNKNFDDVETEVTNNASDIAQNAADISSNANSIIQNAADIASNAQSISDLKTNKLDALTCGDGQVLKYNSGTSSYECAEDIDTNTTLPHTHTTSDITGPITADNLNGFDASTIQALIDAVCMLNRGDIPLLPGNLGSYCSQTVFITSTTYQGDFSNSFEINDICQNHAENAGLLGNFLPWLSGRPSLFYQAPYPYVLIDGTVIANNWDDLVDGTLLNQINIDENGDTVSTTAVWTNVDAAGNQSGSNCSGWNVITGQALTGSNDRTDSGWTNFGNQNCDNFLPLYCFQQ